MKSSFFSVATTFLTFALPAMVFAQGSLTPPGAPAPTMKSLSQMEPRTAITNSGTVTISQPGSYYLTTNITVSSGNGIVITASNVTLDLNGFTVSSTATPANSTGIWIPSGTANIRIENGFVTGSVTNNNSNIFSGNGFQEGVMTGTAATANIVVSHVSVSGVSDEGIYLNTGNSSIIDSCTAYSIGNIGLDASVIRNSAAADCANAGIMGESVSDSRGEAYNVGVSASSANNCYGRTLNGNGTGVSATIAFNCNGFCTNGTGVFSTTAMNCYGNAAGNGTGIYASTANNCYGSSSGGYGLQILQAATGCYGSSSSGVGIYATTANNCSGTSSSSYGLQILGTATGCYGSSSTGTAIYANGANVMACTGIRPGGTDIQAAVGSGCYGSPVGTNLISFKYNMP